MGKGSDMTIPIGNVNQVLGPAARVSFDRAHGPWPDHHDVFHSIGGGNYIKSRVDRDGQVLSSELHEDSVARLVKNIRSRYGD